MASRSLPRIVAFVREPLAPVRVRFALVRVLVSPVGVVLASLGQLRLQTKRRCAVLVTTFGSLRWGEVTALQRADVDLIAGTVRVERSYGDVKGCGLVVGPPKSRAGRRMVTLPTPVLAELRAHLDDVPESADALVFAGPSKARPPLRRNNFRKLARWASAVELVGVPGLHFHDLRHTGNTLASRTGASTRDLMVRMGHDSPRAALIYQHTNAIADKAIAGALSELLRQLSGDAGKGRDDDDGRGRDDDDGAAGFLAPVG